MGQVHVATRVSFALPVTLTAQQKSEALTRRTAGETLMDIARSYNVSFATISRLKA